MQVGDKVRYHCVENFDPTKIVGDAGNGYNVDVVAYVLEVIDEDTITIGWRGDTGWIHPDRLDHPELERQVRERVPRVGTIMVGDRVSPVPEQRAHVNWEPLA